jgi:hypothetical protein
LPRWQSGRSRTGLCWAESGLNPRPARRLLFASFALALAMRVPMAVAPVGADNDMVRYLWDGRVQLLGYNPYLVVPADPSMAHTHTDQTARMPSRHDRTPYPPAAQLFFRLVVAISDSTPATSPYDQVRVRKDFSYCHSAFCRPGLFLVGDAACFIEPVFSSRVYLSTYSALLAARSINTC